MVALLAALAGYYTVANVIYLVLLVLSKRLIKKRIRQSSPDRQIWPKITVLMAAFNEQEVILRSAFSLLSNPYPSLELIIINDGSKDKTFELLKDKFKLKLISETQHQDIYRSSEWSCLKVIDTSNSGKSDSLNSALQFCHGVYVVTLDADTFVEKSAFFHAVEMIESNPDCMAVGGSIRILNGAETDKTGVCRGHLPKKALSMFQIIEYIRAFFGGRLGWEYLGGTALLSGAFSLFRTDALKAINGFDANSVTEDFEIVVRMKHHFASQNKKCDIHMFPDPVCWTIVPETLRTLFWQRVRWQKGLIQTLWKHKLLIFNPAFGRMGLLTLPYMFFFEALSPLVELIAYFAVVVSLFEELISPSLVAGGVVAGIFIYSLISLATIRLEELHYARHDNKKPRTRFILFCLLENFGYRQFLFLARLVGTVSALKSKHNWGEQNRTQIEEKKAA